jgi:hypothetical protein
VLQSLPPESSTSSDACLRPVPLTTGVRYRWVILPVIRVRKGAEALMEEYGGIGPWISSVWVTDPYSFDTDPDPAF